MTDDFTLLHARPDGSYVVRRNGQPYHVLQNDPLYGAVAAEAEGLILPAEPQPPPPPPSPARTLKSDVWRRATAEEADAMDAMLSAAPTKLRRLWDDSTILEHASPDFEQVRGPIIAAFGAQRADELLAPSLGA